MSELQIDVITALADKVAQLGIEKDDLGDRLSDALAENKNLHQTIKTLNFSFDDPATQAELFKKEADQLRIDNARLLNALVVCAPFIRDLQADNHNPAPMGSYYDPALARASELLENEIGNIETARVTPNPFRMPDPGEVWVIPTNDAGAHGRGLAKLANEKLGLRYGFSEGLHRKFYALPTKDRNIKSKPLESIQIGVDRLVECAEENDLIIFLVPLVGCGLAGYTPQQIAPLFLKASKLHNVYLPREFWEVLKTL